VTLHAGVRSQRPPHPRQETQRHEELLMNTDRRAFLHLGLAAGAALASQRVGWSSQAATEAPKKASPGKKNILILGGTSFLGPATVNAARERGHTLTLFNRGK